MFRKIKPNVRLNQIQFPHCDQRVLHGPGECEFCDLHPEWQTLRQSWGIAFTGYQPEDKELPCPADYARGDNHKLWYGNTAKPIHNHLGGVRVGSCSACKQEGELENIDPK